MNNNEKEKVTQPSNNNKKANEDNNKMLIYNNINETKNENTNIGNIEKEKIDEITIEKNNIKENEKKPKKEEKKNNFILKIKEDDKIVKSSENKGEGKDKIGNKREKEKEIKKEKNIELLKIKNIELENQLNKLLTEIKTEENNTLTEKEKYDTKINELDKDIKKHALIKKKIINEISDIEEQINYKYKKVFEDNSIIKNYERNKNNLNNESNNENNNVSEKIEKLIEIKEHQYNNNAKRKRNLIKEISKYIEKIDLYNNINKDVKKENPSIIRKEEELKYLLNKMNKEVESLKSDIILLKNVQHQHNNICRKIKEKLLKELEYIKIEKSNKLEKIEFIQNYKYIQQIRKLKIVNRNKTNLNNLTSIKKINNYNNDITNNKKSNSLLGIYNKNNIKLNSLQQNNRNKAKNIKKPITPQSTEEVSKKNQDFSKNISTPELIDNNNIYEYIKKRIQKIKIKNNKSISLQKIKDNYTSGTISKNLFTEDEKSIFKSYNFIPEENITNFEIKYKNKLEKIKNLAKKIKNKNKIKNEKKVKIQFLIQDNNKKQENINFKNREYNHLIKINGYQILKIKSLIKQKINEEKKIDLNLKNMDFINKKLKGHINVSHDIQNLSTNDGEKKFQNLFNRQVDICENKEIENNENNEKSEISNKIEETAGLEDNDLKDDLNNNKNETTEYNKNNKENDLNKEEEISDNYNNIIENKKYDYINFIKDNNNNLEQNNNFQIDKNEEINKNNESENELEKKDSNINE